MKGSRKGMIMGRKGAFFNFLLRVLFSRNIAHTAPCPTSSTTCPSLLSPLFSLSLFIFFLFSRPSSLLRMSLLFMRDLLAGVKHTISTDIHCHLSPCFSIIRLPHRFFSGSSQFFCSITPNESRSEEGSFFTDNREWLVRLFYFISMIVWSEVNFTHEHSRENAYINVFFNLSILASHTNIILLRWVPSCWCKMLETNI